MATALVRGKIKKIWVVDSGDKNITTSRTVEQIEKDIEERELEKTTKANPRGRKWRRLQRELFELYEELGAYEKDNVLIATFDYPRSGESKLTAIRPLALQSGQHNAKTCNTAGNTADAFLTAGLFKEEVQGETQLQISITDKDPKNPFFTLLRSLITRVFGLVTSTPIGDIANVLVKSAAQEVSENFEASIKPKDAKSRVHIIAESKKVKIAITANGINVLNANESGIVFTNGTLTLDLKAPQQFGKIGSDKANGQVVLELTSETL